MEFIRYGGTPPRGCPSALWDDLCLTGLPKKVITIFKASPEPVLASANLDGHRTNGIVLGYSREDQELYLDFDSGKVWRLWVEDSGHMIVNRSLQAFRESLIWVDARYPFHPSDRTLDAAWVAEQAIRQALVDIDDTATAEPDGFWSAFLDDVAVGDYAGP